MLIFSTPALTSFLGSTHERRCCIYALRVNQAQRSGTSFCIARGSSWQDAFAQCIILAYTYGWPAFSGLAFSRLCQRWPEVTHSDYPFSHDCVHCRWYAERKSSLVYWLRQGRNSGTKSQPVHQVLLMVDGELCGVHCMHMAYSLFTVAEWCYVHAAGPASIAYVIHSHRRTPSAIDPWTTDGKGNEFHHACSRLMDTFTPAAIIF